MKMKKNYLKFLDLLNRFENPNWLGNQIGIVIKATSFATEEPTTASRRMQKSKHNHEQSAR